MKKLIYIAVFILGSSCSKNMNEISVDPVNPTKIDPSSIFTTLSITAFGPEFYGMDPYFDSWFVNYYDGGNRFNWTRRDFANEYKNIYYVNDMNKEADRVEKPVYKAIGSFFRAYHLFNATRLFGDIPYREAAKGKEGIFAPEYDQQEDIIVGILGELEQANRTLAELKDAKIDGDIIYKGDLTKWRKLINMFRLRILLNCTMHETLGGKSVASLFESIVSNSTQNPLMGVLGDSPIREETGNLSNYYLYSNNNFITGYRVTSFLVDYMRDRQDRRLTKFANPMILLENNPNVNINDLTNYAGVTPNPDLKNNSNLVSESARKLSRVNNRYHRNPVGPSTMNMGFIEQQLILAEAAVRGWIEADPSSYYRQAVEASFLFYGFQKEDAQLYLQQPEVRLTGSGSDDIERIITQKYLNFFFQGGWEAYFELRRTGYPKFDRYVSTVPVSNYNDNKLPLRFQYPMVEITDNNAHVSTAIARLQEGDVVNAKMWLVKGTDKFRNPKPFPFQ